jgi:recombinational DNA repair ATPase RecF
MLRRVEIENYRSCRSIVLDDLSPLTALVGKNGAGKTNVLTAITTAAHAATSPDAEALRFAWVSAGLRVSLEFSTNGSIYRSMEQGGTQVRRLSATEIAAARSYLDDAGSLSGFIETVEQD